MGLSPTPLGFSLENLDPEKLSISLTGSQLGMDSMESLVREVCQALGALPEGDAGGMGTGCLAAGIACAKQGKV